jgi:hypothetical protein
MTGDLNCPACVILVIGPGGPGQWRDAWCTGRAGCVRAVVRSERTTEPADGVDWGRATQYLKDNEQGLMDLMAKVDDLMIEGAVSHAATVEHPERETPAPESGPAGADVPDGKADIVERLRQGTVMADVRWPGDNSPPVDEYETDALMAEAADEIARLRAEVERLTRERDDFRRIAQNFSDELGQISTAIGTDEFMPEGAPVPLRVQVSRMKAALDRARSEVLDLRYVIAGILLDENNRGMSVKDKWESALKAITDVIVDGSVVSQGYADRIRRDGIAAGRLDREGGR